MFVCTKFKISETPSPISFKFSTIIAMYSYRVFMYIFHLSPISQASYHRFPYYLYIDIAHTVLSIGYTVVFPISMATHTMDSSSKWDILSGPITDILFKQSYKC